MRVNFRCSLNDLKTTKITEYMFQIMCTYNDEDMNVQQIVGEIQYMRSINTKN